MSPQAFFKLKVELDAIIAEAQAQLDQAEKDSAKAPLPKHLRAATVADVVVGAILWYKTGTEDKPHHYWNVIESVPENFDKMGWYKSGSCRYTLEGALVEE